MAGTGGCFSCLLFRWHLLWWPISNRHKCSSLLPLFLWDTPFSIKSHLQKSRMSWIVKVFSSLKPFLDFYWAYACFLPLHSCYLLGKMRQCVVLMCLCGLSFYLVLLLWLLCLHGDRTSCMLYVFVHVPVCGCTCVWLYLEGRGPCWVSSSIIIHHIFWDGVSYHTQSSLIWLGTLGSCLSLFILRASLVYTASSGLTRAI